MTAAPPENAVNQRSTAILGYRWFVFVLVLGYWIYQFNQVLDPTKGFGWQFRYLTIWALTVSLLSGFAVLRLSMGWTDRRPDVLAGLAVVMNVMVVYLYWKLFLADRANVNDGSPIIWWQEYYLHALGPLLQWIDAFFLMGVFRRPWATALALLLVILAYVGWAEIVVQSTNSLPVGSVTHGLPYPFLNNLDFAGRFAFYASSAVMAMAVLAAGWALNRFVLRR